MCALMVLLLAYSGFSNTGYGTGQISNKYIAPRVILAYYLFTIDNIMYHKILIHIVEIVMSMFNYIIHCQKMVVKIDKYNL